MGWLYIEPEGIEFNVNEEWLKIYFEQKIKLSVLSFDTKMPLYDNFEDWFEDYGYEKGRQVYIDAKKDNAVIQIRKI